MEILAGFLLGILSTAGFLAFSAKYKAEKERKRKLRLNELNRIDQQRKLVQMLGNVEIYNGTEEGQKRIE